MVAAMVRLLVLWAVLAAAPHPKDFWQAIVKNRFVPPDGTTAGQLIPELLANLGSGDPELRDDLSTTILTAWIYQTKSLGPDDLRPMAATLRANLRKGIGDTGGGGVLLRSFSALILSIIAARDNDAPFLSSEEHAALLASTLDYFRDERDLRGFDDGVGWMHSAAHTSDLLKFLARSDRLRPGAQADILAALTDKNRTAASPFAQGEDERMARVVISIVRRSDFDRTAYATWLETMSRLAAFPRPADGAALRAQQNARHLMTSLFTELSADERPSAGADFARDALRAALKKLF
jgi:Protein of unknown function (DUF2785)